MGGGQFTTTTSAQVAVPGNTKRKSITISNDDSTNVIYMQPVNTMPGTIVATTAPIRIGPGLTAGITENDDGPAVTQSPFWAIAKAGTPVGLWTEGLK